MTVSSLKQEEDSQSIIAAKAHENADIIERIIGGYFLTKILFFSLPSSVRINSSCDSRKIHVYMGLGSLIILHCLTSTSLFKIGSNLGSFLPKTRNKIHSKKFQLLSKEGLQQERTQQITTIFHEFLILFVFLASIIYYHSSVCEDMTTIYEGTCENSQPSFFCSANALAIKSFCSTNSAFSAIAKARGAFSLALIFTLTSNFSDISSLMKGFFSRKIENKIN